MKIDVIFEKLVKITYTNNKVEKYFNDYSKMQKKLPFEWVKTIKKHMNRPQAAECFGDFLMLGLEYALGEPKSFWLNLQANCETELLEFNEENTITEEERSVMENLNEIVKYLRQRDMIPARELKERK